MYLFTSMLISVIDKYIKVWYERNLLFIERVRIGYE